MPQNELITFDHVTMVHDRQTTLDDINLTVNDGDFLAITGPNGGGKTTLLRLLLKLIKPTRGTVAYHEPLRIGYLPQKSQLDSKFPITVDEVIGSGLMDSGDLTSAQRRERVADTIALMGLDSHATKPIGTLSGGQLQRTLIGRAIIARPKLLVLDEPLSYLDKDHEEHLYRIIADMTPSTTIIMVTHEMSTISSMATRHIIINRTLHECPSHHHYSASCC